MQIAKSNAQIIVQNATAYPFKLPGSLLVCVYCCDDFKDSLVFRKHMKDEHVEFGINVAFAHCHENYLKADCTELTCRICNDPFDTLMDVAKHLKAIHGFEELDLDHGIAIQMFKPDKLSCALCDAKFCHLKNLSRHTQTHYSTFTCEACGKTYSTSTTLAAHIKTSHSTEKRDCKKCKETFDSLAELNDHLSKSKRCCLHVCDICYERFPLWRKKQSHMQQVHGKPKNKYTCLECGKVYKKRDSLRVHFKIMHTKDHFQCTICLKKFETAHTLKRHKMVHTGEKKFYCAVCGKAFPRKCTLATHLWIHADVKKYNCRDCDKQFNQRVRWRVHMKTLHPESNVK